MKEQVNLNGFCNAFKDMDRDNNFSYEGKRALFDYLTELEEDTGQEIKLDVIAICCDYIEYKDIKEYLDDYDTDLKASDYEEQDDLKEDLEQEINDKTTLIKLSDDLDDGFIIQNY